MPTKILEDMVIQALPPEVQDAARDQLDELLEEGERLRVKSEALLEEAEDAMATWKADNPVVGSIEWHLKRADAEVRRAWEDTIQATVKAWEKDHLGGGSKGELLDLISFMGARLLPALVSAMTMNAPVEPTVKPKVTAAQVIAALKKEPDLFQGVREELIASMRVIEVRSWERLPLEGNTTKKLPLEVPDGFPSGPVTITMDTVEYWPPNTTITGEFHVIGGELDVPMERPSSRFPMIRTAHLERLPNRKIVVHVRSSNEGYMNGVKLAVTPHVG